MSQRFTSGRQSQAVVDDHKPDRKTPQPGVDKSGWRTAFTVFLLCASTVLASPAQTFTTLFTFDGSDGYYPMAGLVQGINGDRYGTTSGAGSYAAAGTVFKITPGGALTTLYNFCAQSGCADGAWPLAGLTLATSGEFYGTTSGGGAYGGGTVFKISPGGSLTTLYNFCSQSGCTDGLDPSAELVRAPDGNFYGTTYRGGTGNGGTVFKINPSGVFSTLYSFCAKSVYPNCPDGDFPGTGLVQATSGSLYGITIGGGINGYGTVFEITPSGQLSTIYSFCPLGVCTDGSSPVGGLVQATNGDLYGITDAGGSLDLGTVFKITPRGSYTMLYSFCSNYPSCTDGESPLAGLVQASNGDFYGTTRAGGANGDGTIFQITPSGTLTTIYNFCSQVGCTDGYYSLGFEQATNGDFYGTTLYGGPDQYGSVFRLSVGLGRFAETLPTSGKVGSVVKILGNDLTGATSVTFNGVAATFEVNTTGTAISTTVPTGATAGTVQVVTPAGTLSSNVPFRVTP